ncbi:MAG: hypothetical protein WC971_03990 [Coriobacteriia bacterium]
MPVLVEVSGADSIAAALAFADSHPEVADYVPSYASTGTEFGDFSGIEANVALLREELGLRTGARLSDLVRLADPTLWRALNGRFASALAARFGAWLPCVGCHLYLHVLRVPLARELDTSVIVSGERERHGARTKANQTPEALDAYARVLAHAGIELALPVRGIAATSGIESLLGPRWPGGSPQLRCVLSDNEKALDGSPVVSGPPAALLSEYLVPAGMAIVDAMGSGRTDWETVVGDVLAGNHS